jgi:hypothetical protein
MGGLGARVRVASSPRRTRLQAARAEDTRALTSVAVGGAIALVVGGMEPSKVGNSRGYLLATTEVTMHANATVVVDELMTEKMTYGTWGLIKGWLISKRRLSDLFPTA